MDFGGFILFILMALGVVVGAVVVTALFIFKSRYRKVALAAFLAGCALTALFGRLLYQVYWLDEELWAAAQEGNEEEVRALLKRGANPNAQWESGQSALEAAIEGRHEGIARILREAGAK